VRERYRPLIQAFWEDRVFLFFSSLKFIAAALFIFEIYQLRGSLNEQDCRYAVEVTTRTAEEILQ